MQLTPTMLETLSKEERGRTRHLRLRMLNERAKGSVEQVLVGELEKNGKSGDK